MSTKCDRRVTQEHEDDGCVVDELLCCSISEDKAGLRVKRDKRTGPEALWSLCAHPASAP